MQFQRGKLELQPGCNAEQSLETLVTGKLNTIRETASKVQRLPAQGVQGTGSGGGCASAGLPCNGSASRGWLPADV